MKMKTLLRLTLTANLAAACFAAGAGSRSVSQPVVDTGQVKCYDNVREIRYPRGRDSSGQDAQYEGNVPEYRDNGDGTVSDLVTGLMWSREVSPNKVSLVEAEAIAAEMTLGGHSGWRVPNIKFDFHDRDRDRFLSDDEAPHGPPPHTRGRPPRR